MAKLKILHVLDTIDPAGAGPVEAARLYCSLPTHDYQPEILSLDNDVEPWRKFWTVPIHTAARSPWLPRYSPNLVPWLRENGPRYDAVVVHGVWGYHLIGVWRALRNRVPYFVILHGALNPWFGKTYPRKHYKKVAFWRLLTGRAVAGASAILYLCPEEKRLADPSFRLRSRVHAFVPLGINPRRSNADAFLDRFPALRAKRLLLFFGRICYMKGCDLLLDAFAEAAASDASAHLVICGTDHEQWRSTLMRRAEVLRIADKVTWTGPLYGDDRWPAIAAAELLVLPSRCETFPIVVLEALSCGVPVLVTKDVNIHPQIAQSGAGIVCESTSVSVASALRSWLSRDSADRRAFADRATQCQLSEFDLRTAIDLHMEAIREHLPRPASARARRFPSKSKESVRRILSRRLTEHTVHSGPLRGAKLFTSWHDYPGAILGTTERTLIRWFQSNVGEGETWLDVGAHYGYTSIALSRLVGPAGRVFAFEPMPDTAEALVRTRAANSLDHLTVVPFALNDQPRRTELRIATTRGMADSTVSAPESYETISAISLDSYWPQLSGHNPQIHGIKIDVQGMELQVLTGMRRTLAAWRPKLIVEFHTGVDRAAILELIASAGYSLSYRAIDGRNPRLADDNSYVFEPEVSACASSSTRSTTARS